MVSRHILLCVSLIVGPVISWSAYHIPPSSDPIRTTQSTHSQRVLRCFVPRQIPTYNIARFMAPDIGGVQQSIQKTLRDSILSSLSQYFADATSWANQFGLEEDSGAIFYALFYAIRSSVKLGLRGHPFYITESDIRSSCAEFLSPNDRLSGFFTFDDLTQALEDDFLDANRGVANSKREAWKVRLVFTMSFISMNIFVQIPSMSSSPSTL